MSDQGERWDRAAGLRADAPASARVGKDPPFRSAVAAVAGRMRRLEQFQQKCVALLRPELRQNKKTKQFQQKCVALLRPELRQNKKTKQFQQKCVALLRPELRQNKKTKQFQHKCVALLRPELWQNGDTKHFRGSEESGNARWKLPAAQPDDCWLDVRKQLLDLPQMRAAEPAAPSAPAAPFGRRPTGRGTGVPAPGTGRLAGCLPAVSHLLLRTGRHVRLSAPTGNDWFIAAALVAFFALGYLAALASVA